MFLVDTNVISELRKQRRGMCNENVAKWAESSFLNELFLSAMTILELEVGILLVERRDSTQAMNLRVWMNGQILGRFAGRILPVDTEVAQIAAKLQVPDPSPFSDAIIAATAIRHKMTVVTRNVTDFQRNGVTILNPWHWGA